MMKLLVILFIMKLIAQIDIFKSETDVEAVEKQDLCNWKVKIN